MARPPWRLVLLPGDGIGPEVLAAVRPLLERASWEFESRSGRRLDVQEAVVGGAAVDRFGTPLPEETLRCAQSADAVLLGAVGGPAWDGLAPDRRPEAGLLALRRALGVYANLRPARTLPATRSPLRPEVALGVDVLLVRELTGGLYFGEPRRRWVRQDGLRAAVDTMTYDEEEIRRVARVAFEAARERRGRVTSVDKANVLACSRLWREVVTEVAGEYPDVRLDHQLVDSATLRLVQRPDEYDVILTENLFGDILSDLLGGIVGQFGALASASLGADGPGLFEPVHGSAPDLAGRDLATPAGAILSFALACRYAFGAPDLAQFLTEAVDDVLGEDAGLGTRAFGERVAHHFWLRSHVALT
ncbi:MAG: 3-isopropylmalate dehydrogenase [Thermaerobacter sp.]|nr:3-isopropylmalate dehydrogenase [Thermaerobacter sp.]